ncbi:N-acetyl-D-Glu racemase DgcA [Shewanella surugensis]|uniref:Dipeptide epimerase n=1 Tax=Shewanella surugensis TaxID=212020 RepID=A0ABT0LEW6_9GAMM|nr:N-acetyl-D-Glu racemase DgcA [Shewanella surugensis]MCL1126244.1 dipeptide epimerase [Shewanella surugensis]
MQLQMYSEKWVLDTPFVISRESTSCQDVLVVEASDGQHMGHGESSPTARYGESVESIISQFTLLQQRLKDDPDIILTPQSLQALMRPGAARNAVDCALWDLVSKQQHKPVWQYFDMSEPKPVDTVFTISLDRPQAMALAAKKVKGHAVLKLKFGGEGDIDRIAAIRDVLPDQRLIIDANEAWSPDQIELLLDVMHKNNVEMVEQPLCAGQDDILSSIKHPMTICADESCHTSLDLASLVGKYDMVNIKLDKTGGLTEAMMLLKKAKEMNFEIMVGCMVGTSLAMAPGLLIAQHSQYVDLDGPLLMGRDRDVALKYAEGLVYPNHQGLWG